MKRIIFLLVAVATLVASSPSRRPHLDTLLKRRPRSS